MVLWSGCFVAWVHTLTRGRVDLDIWTDCKLSYALFSFGRHYSSMLLVLMSIEKCFAVYFPFKSKAICTIKTAKWATGILGVILAGYNLRWIFTIESKFNVWIGGYICASNDNYRYVFDYIDSILYSYGPFLLILLTNFAIALRFMRAKCRNIQSNCTESTSQALSKSATRGTAMVVTVSVTFLILTAPTAVHLTINPLGIRFPLYLAFMNLTQYLNNSINGVLYIIVGSKFRKELIELFHRKKGPGARRLPIQSPASPI